MEESISVENYINSQNDSIKEILIKVRNIIRTEAPNAIESISYGMPAYKINGKPLVYFGANKFHLGFYATPTGHEMFKDKLSKYKSGKGSVQFPYNLEIPYNLIKEIVKFKIKDTEN